MDFFYIRHHYQSIVRSQSFSGEVFAFVTLAILFGSSVSLMSGLLENYVESLSTFFGRERVDYHLFLMAYLFVDLLIRLVFRRPFPKLKYYMLWSDRSKAIASQYLLTSLFGIIPFVMAITMLMIGFKAQDWLASNAMISIVIWWVVNHFVGLITQFSKSWVKSILLGTMLLILILEFFLPQASIAMMVINPFVALSLLLVAILVAFLQVKKVIEKRELVSDAKGGVILDSLPVLSFKNPVFQLEWALLVRNKRTRSNLLLGLVSVLILPFMLKGDSDAMLTTLIFFITTGFFIIQHGVYSLGWEGSYFDFLITNISPKNFIKTRYLFYVGTCLIGLLLASIPTLIQGLNWVTLLMIFLYNAGITVPLVLYRSTLNNTKIVLTENSFMNYNGMMTGPIFVSSFLVMLLPLFVYGIGLAFLGENSIYLLGVLGVAGLIGFRPITDLVAKKYHRKKYYLSQSFKA